VRIRSTNFGSGGALYGYQNSTSNTSLTDQRDNGVDPAGNNPSASGVLSGSLTIGVASQPTAEPDFTASGNGAHGPKGDVTDNLTVDFGFYDLTLGNLVFEDKNSDGDYDSGGVTPDVGLASATVALYQSDGTTIVPVGPDGILGTTDDTSAPSNQVVTPGSGAYLFKALPPGSYIVKVTPPSGFKSTNDIGSSGDPNNGTDHDDNGVGNSTGQVASAAITLTAAGGTGATVTNSTGTTDQPTLDFGFVPQAPTAVRLTELTAQANVQADAKGRRGVTINWRTGFEADNLGFNLYRAEDGRRVSVNPALIAGSALFAGVATQMTAGQSYTWLDPAGAAGASYWLEAVDGAGLRTWHGPAYATESFAAKNEFQPQAMLLSEVNDAAQARRLIAQREWAEETGRQGGGATGRAEYARSAPWTLPGQTALKLAVRQAGWYRVTQAEMAAAGFNTNFDPQRLQLFADGVEAPLQVVAANPSRFAPGDYVEFYGRGLDTPTTDTRTYWLIEGQTTGRRLVVGMARLPKQANVASFTSTVERKDRLIYFASLLNGDAENWFGPSVSSGSATTQTLTLRSVVNAPATLEIALQGVTLQAHAVSVTLNGRDLGALYFKERELSTQRLSVPARTLVESENKLSLTAVGGGSDISQLACVRLSYARLYRAADDALNFALGAGQAAYIGGFSNPRLRLLQLSNGQPVRELMVKPQFDGQSYGFALQAEESGAFLALTDARLQRVESLKLNQPSDWRGTQNSADLLILTHRDFAASAQRLALARQAQGWRTVVIDVEDVYDEFNFGAPSPQAIKSLLVCASKQWRRVPRYLLFIGDASSDPRNYLGTGSKDFIPTRLGATALLETALDHWYADLDDDGAPEFALGRLPVRTAEQADAVVAKLISFRPEEKPRGALLVSDRASDGVNYQGLSEQLATALPALMLKQFVNRNDGSPEQVRNQIVKSINETAPLIVNWLGHGSVEVWTGDGLLRVQDAEALTNRLPALFVMTTCLNGYFSDPNQTSLGEAALLNPTGGAVAVLASSALTSPLPQFTFNRELYRQLFAGRPLGDALRGAKAAARNRDVSQSYTLFGDPTLAVAR
jgi:hypothetical protein